MHCVIDLNYTLITEHIKLIVLLLCTDAGGCEGNGNCAHPKTKTPHKTVNKNEVTPKVAPKQPKTYEG